MWKKRTASDRALDEHALGVTGDELGGGGLAVIGDEDRRFLVAQVHHEELTERSAGQCHRLLEHARCLVLARGHLQGDAAPGRRGQTLDFGE